MGRAADADIFVLHIDIMPTIFFMFFYLTSFLSVFYKNICFIFIGHFRAERTQQARQLVANKTSDHEYDLVNNDFLWSRPRWHG